MLFLTYCLLIFLQSCCYEQLCPPPINTCSPSRTTTREGVPPRTRKQDCTCAHITHLRMLTFMLKNQLGLLKQYVQYAYSLILELYMSYDVYHRLCCYAYCMYYYLHCLI